MSVTTICSEGLIMEVAVIRVVSRCPAMPLPLGTLTVAVTQLVWPGVKVTGVLAVTLLHG